MYEGVEGGGGGEGGKGMRLFVQIGQCGVVKVKYPARL